MTGVRRRGGGVASRARPAQEFAGATCAVRLVLAVLTRSGGEITDMTPLVQHRWAVAAGVTALVALAVLTLIGTW